ncbi:TIGR01777 family oxidoreductase [Rubritalea spongiae]
MKNSVGIIGASGLLGGKLAGEYDSMDWEVVRFSRKEREVAGQNWKKLSAEALSGLDVLVNLAGEPIDQRWTEENKKLFWESRVGVTEQITKMVSQLPSEDRPKTWVNASAVGIYGDGGESELIEESPTADGYLAELCEHWERAASAIEVSTCQVFSIRIGVVLGKESAAWKKMASIFKLGLGGRLGSGQQWFPWIHIDDIVGGIVHLSQIEGACGAYNLVAPEQVRNVEFTKSLASELNRPAILPVPSFGLKLMLGEFADALLASQRVSSEKLRQTGYKWRYPDLKSALKQLNEG